MVHPLGWVFLEQIGTAASKRRRVRLVQELDVDRTAASSPIFQSMLVFGSSKVDCRCRKGRHRRGSRPFWRQHQAMGAK